MRENVVAAILALLLSRGWVNVSDRQGLVEILWIELALSRLTAFKIDHSGDLTLWLGFPMRNLHRFASTYRVSVASTRFSTGTAVMISSVLTICVVFMDLNVEIREELNLASRAQVRGSGPHGRLIPRVSFQAHHRANWRGISWLIWCVEFAINEKRLSHTNHWSYIVFIIISDITCWLVLALVLRQRWFSPSGHVVIRSNFPRVFEFTESWHVCRASCIHRLYWCLLKTFQVALTERRLHTFHPLLRLRQMRLRFIIIFKF